MIPTITIYQLKHTHILKFPRKTCSSIWINVSPILQHSDSASPFYPVCTIYPSQTTAQPPCISLLSPNQFLDENLFSFQSFLTTPLQAINIVPIGIKNTVSGCDHGNQFSQELVISLFSKVLPQYVFSCPKFLLQKLLFLNFFDATFLTQPIQCSYEYPHSRHWQSRTPQLWEIQT